jgi:hypothetical protein
LTIWRSWLCSKLTQRLQPQPSKLMRPLHPPRKATTPPTRRILRERTQRASPSTTSANTLLACFPPLSRCGSTSRRLGEVMRGMRKRDSRPHAAPPRKFERLSISQATGGTSGRRRRLTSTRDSTRFVPSLGVWRGGANAQRVSTTSRRPHRARCRALPIGVDRCSRTPPQGEVPHGPLWPTRTRLRSAPWLSRRHFPRPPQY